MKLIIDTTDQQRLRLALMDGQKRLGAANVAAFRRQGEKLLPAIMRLMSRRQLTWSAVRQIVVVNGSGSFSGLRIGVATANALAYALRLPVSDQNGRFLKIPAGQIVEPIYDGQPNISTPAVDK